MSLPFLAWMCRLPVTAASSFFSCNVQKNCHLCCLLLRSRTCYNLFYYQKHKHMVPHLVWPNLLHFYVHFNQGRHHIEFSQDEMREIYSLYKAQITFTTHNIQNCLCLLKSWFVSWTVGILLNSTIHWTHCTNPQPRFHCCQKMKYGTSLTKDYSG